MMVLISSGLDHIVSINQSILLERVKPKLVKIAQKAARNLHAEIKVDISF